MKVEFNNNSYNIGTVIRGVACERCVLNEGLYCRCPVNSQGLCILPSDKIYIDCCSNQVFKL